MSEVACQYNSQYEVRGMLTATLVRDAQFVFFVDCPALLRLTSWKRTVREQTTGGALSDILGPVPLESRNHSSSSSAFRFFVLPETASADFVVLLFFGAAVGRRADGSSTVSGTGRLTVCTRCALSSAPRVVLESRFVPFFFFFFTLSAGGRDEEEATGLVAALPLDAKMSSISEVAMGGGKRPRQEKKTWWSRAGA